jgi:hypothetical protein
MQTCATAQERGYVQRNVDRSARKTKIRIARLSRPEPSAVLIVVERFSGTGVAAVGGPEIWLSSSARHEIGEVVRVYLVSSRRKLHEN